MLPSDEQTTAPTTVTAYKGFDKDLKCRGFQYVLGDTAVHDGEVEACGSGLHACEYPLDVLAYYGPTTSRFAVVEQSGQLSRHSSDSKVASSVLTVKAEVGLPGLIKAAIEYTTKRCKPADPASFAFNSGDYGASTNSGDYGASTNSGTSGASTNSGDYGAPTNSGAHGVAADFNGTGKARSSESGAIICIHRGDKGEILHIRASKVGKNGIKPDVYYTLNAAGEFVEVGA